MSPHGNAGPDRLPLQSKIFFMAILLLFLFLFWTLFKPFVIYIATGIFVAVLSLGIDKKWEKILPNKVAAFGTMFTIFLILTVPVLGLGFGIAKDAATVAEKLQAGEGEQILQDLAGIVMPGATPEERNATVDRIYTEQVQPWLLEQAQGLAAKAGGFLVEFGIAVTIILFVTYYVLTDGHRLVAYVRRASPLPTEQMDFLMKEAHGGLKAVFFGQIVTSLIQGALGGIGFLIAGVPGAIVWAGVMAILSLLPVIGPPVVWIPASIFLLVQGDIWQGVFLLAWGGILVAQVDNFIRPKLIGDRADIHPLFVLIGVLGGVAAFGFMGLFLGPLLVGLTVSVLKVWERDYLDEDIQDHNLQTMTDIDKALEAERTKMTKKQLEEIAEKEKEADTPISAKYSESVADDVPGDSDGKNKKP